LAVFITSINDSFNFLSLGGLGGLILGGLAVDIASEWTFEELGSDLVANEEVNGQQQTSRALLTRRNSVTHNYS